MGPSLNPSSDCRSGANRDRDNAATAQAAHSSRIHGGRSEKRRALALSHTDDPPSAQDGCAPGFSPFLWSGSLLTDQNASGLKAPDDDHPPSAQDGLRSRLQPRSSCLDRHSLIEKRRA